MKKKTLFLALTALLCVSCGNFSSKPGSSVPASASSSESSSEEDQIKAVYRLYRANGGTLSYEDWLASIKGEPGKDGLSFRTGYGTPSSSMGNDGDSYLDYLTYDLYLKVGGFWTKTGNIKAAPGGSGSSGPSFYSGVGEPDASFGNVGDTYFDYEHFAFYVKEATGWTFLAKAEKSSSPIQPTVQGDLTYWCPPAQKDFMEELVADFKTANSAYADLDIVCLDTCGEGDVYPRLVKDSGAAADVMLMDDFSYRAAAKKQQIAEVNPAYSFIHSLTDTPYMSSMVNGKIYGYPYACPNAPMPIYDTALFPTEPTSFETILQTAKAAGKKVYFDIGNAWYNPALIWCGGGGFEVDQNGLIQTNLTGETKTKVAKSLEAFKALFNEYKDTWVSSSDNAAIETDFKNKKCAYAFLWNDLSVIQAGNAKVAVGMWPTIRIGGYDTQMTCFNSTKFAVIKAGLEERRLNLANRFAEFIASPANQVKRLEAVGELPASLKSIDLSTLEPYPFLHGVARMEMMALTHGLGRCTNGDFWDPMTNLGGLLTNGKETWGDYADASKVIDALLKNKGWYA